MSWLTVADNMALASFGVFWFLLLVYIKLASKLKRPL